MDAFLVYQYVLVGTKLLVKEVTFTVVNNFCTKGTKVTL
jgi:hypothetical protein